MKKLMLLIILLLLSWNSTSQQGTVSKSVDSIIPLKVPIVKLVIKDLIKGDRDKEELVQAYKYLKLTSEKVELQKEIIDNLGNKISNLETSLLTKDEQLKLSNDLTTDLVKELKSEKRKTFLYKVGTGVGIIATAVILLQKWKA